MAGRVSSGLGHGPRARLGLLAAALIAAAAGLQGWLAPLERAFLDWQTRLVTTAASGEILLVEIDPASIEALERWPWPRRLHAEAVSALAAADPHLIAFDVDFSSRQTAADDQALAAALAAAKQTVILAAFEQAGAAPSDRVATLPLPAFRQNSFVGSANVMPDPDGAVRTYPAATRIGGTVRPSLATLVAEANLSGSDAIVIDYGIDSASIPRLSFVDLVRGDFDPASIAGKRVLIGATAIELGDRYHIPGQGLVPGVVVQALAAETLLQERPLVPLSRLAAAFLAVAAAVPLALSFGARRRFLLTGAASALAAALLMAWLRLDFGLLLNGAAAAAAWTLVMLGGAALEIRLQFRRRELLNPVTMLPNRRVLERELARPARARETLAVVRVQGYDKILSAAGAETAQLLLLDVARRIAARSDDTDVYQLGNNLFALLLDPVRFDPETWFAGLELALRNGVARGEVKADIRLGAGFDTGGAADDSFGSRIDRSLLALSQAEGRNQRLGWAGQQDQSEERWRIGMASALRGAIDEGDLRLVFQPKLCLRTNQIRQVEALVRWTDPQRGSIFPDQFIPIAEANGSIGDLTRFVVAEAVRTAAALQGAGFETGVAVNISTSDLADPGFAAFVADCLARTRIPPHLLTLEITETGMLEGRETALAAARALKDMGLRLSIDDYGTGQSTMSYVEQFPADELKIDMSFVMKMMDDKANAILVNSAIDLAHALDLQVVAEGVENEAIMSALRARGCDYAQGYHIARPLDYAALIDFLRQAAPAMGRVA
ncbi:MAG TPA: EAL domain-containing protein [Paracoccaceae bacterium]|nr:EAL domain-containing protein [Paracoccaceae bacterium]